MKLKTWWVVMMAGEGDGSIHPSTWGMGVDDDDQFATEAEAITAAWGRCAGYDSEAEFVVYRIQAVARVATRISPPRVTRLDGKKEPRNG